MNNRERIIKASEIAIRYAMIDGAHHKMWVIDQMLRILLENYDDVIKTFNEPDEYENWDTGIAP